MASLPALAATQRVRAVLVKSDAHLGQNPASTFPHAEFAPYKDTAYRWNAAGQNLLGAAFPFSITQLDANGTQEASDRAAWNHRQVSWTVHMQREAIGASMPGPLMHISKRFSTSLSARAPWFAFDSSSSCMCDGRMVQLDMHIVRRSCSAFGPAHAS